MKRIDLLFDIERTINGKTAEQRLAAREELSASLLADLEDWMRTERARLSRHSPVAKAMDYMLTRWDRFARFLDGCTLHIVGVGDNRIGKDLNRTLA